jgi:O-antigen ligase
MALSLVLTMSRSGMMGLAVAAVLAGTVMARRQSGASRRALTVGYLVFVVIVVVSWVGLDQIAARFAR